MRSNFINSVKKKIEGLLALLLITTQLLFPLTVLQSTPVFAAAGDMSVGDHEGQLAPSGTYSNGNIKTYAEQESIDFRFDVTSAAVGVSSGQVQVEFSEDDGNCTFFDGSFTLGTINNLSGATPTVTTNGTPTVNGGDWIQLLDISFPATGSAEVHYALTLTDEAGNCNGSSTHTQLGNGPIPGDMKNIGNQTVSIPAKDIVELATITITKQVDTNGDGIIDRPALENEWSFALDGGTPVGTDSNGQVVFSGLISGSYSVTESDEAGYELSSVSGTNCVAGQDPLSALATVVAAKSATDATCVFTNTFVVPSGLILEKNVVNTNGGTLGVSDFTPRVDGNVVAWDTFIPLSAGNYTASEDATFGYSASAWGGDCADDGVVAIAAGQTKTCTITNDDIAPIIRLFKTVVNDNGGQASSDDFTPYIDDEVVAWGVPITTSAGFHNVSEETNIGISGYTSGEWGGACANVSSGLASITLVPGDEVECTITNDDQAGRILLNKVVVNDNGGTLTAADFSLTIDGAVVPQGIDQGVEANTPHIIDEHPVAGYEFVEITGSPECPSILGGTLTVPNGVSNIECTIVNTDIAPTLTLVKTVTNNDGGTAAPADWTLSATPSGTHQLISGNGEDGAVQVPAVAGVSYMLNETGPDGYFYGSWNCEGGTLDEDSVTLGLGEDVVCTVNNNDLAPVVTLVKDVTNNNGGDALATAFELILTGTSAESFVSGQSTNVVANADYSLSELNPIAHPNGYEQLNLVCLDNTSGAIVNVGAVINLDPGQEVTCTFYNDDISPTLVIVKEITNDDGGTLVVADFPLFVGNVSVVSGVSNDFDAGDYTISETQADGYTLLDLLQGDCALSNDAITVTLEIGGSYTCTLTNDDQPAEITVVKSVENDDGGSAVAGDFSLSVNGTPVSQNVGSTFPAGVEYSITETYDAAVIGDYTRTTTVCVDNSSQTEVDYPFTPSVGQSVTCTVTNTDDSSTLTLNKSLPNDNGGTATPADFQAYVDQSAVDWNVGTTVSAGLHTASEDTISGYTPSEWGGDCAVDGTINLLPGQSAWCSIENNDEPAVIIVNKTVTNDNGGLLNASDFAAFVDGNSAVWGNENVVDAGFHTVSETPANGYTPSVWSGDCAADGSVTVAPGEVAFCDITNDDDAPTVTLLKEVDNNFGGTLVADSFTLELSGEAVQQGVATEVLANANLTITEDDVNGYEFVGITGDSCPLELGGSFQLSPGQNVICTVTNQDLPATVIVEKATLPFESNQAFDFVLTNDQNETTFTLDTDAGDGTHEQVETIENLSAGTVAISEVAVDGWSSGVSVYCYPVGIADYLIDGSGIQAQLDYVDVLGETDVEFEIALGETVYCEYLNAEYGSVTVTKYNDINENGLQEDGELSLEGWDINLHEISTIFDEDRDMIPEQIASTVEELDDLFPIRDTQATGEDGTTTFDDVLPVKLGLYGVSEELQDGWHQTGIYCEFPFLFDDRIVTPQSALNDQNMTPFPGNEFALAYVAAGQNTQCYIGNAPNPVLEIEKSNNLPLGDYGDEVTYTINVSVPEDSGSVFDSNGACRAPIGFMQPFELEVRRPFCGVSVMPINEVTDTVQEDYFCLEFIYECGNEMETEAVTVTDLPPEGFAYVPGSYTANSNVRGDLVAAGITSDPAYASPGTWDLTNSDSNFLVPGEVVTLTYRATLTNLATLGTHPDTAFTHGFTASDTDDVYGNVHLVDTPFVSSEVAILDAPELVEGQVLGLQTLANTGQPIAFLNTIVGLTLAGAALLPLAAKSRRFRRLIGKAHKLVPQTLLSVALSVLMVGGLVMVNSQSVQAQSFETWSLQLFEPQVDTTNDSINLEYQVLSVDETDTFEVEGFQDGVSLGTQSVSTAFGDSGFFAIDLPAEGEYEFFVVANNLGASEAKSSDVQTVNFDVQAPAAPELGQVVRNDNTYAINFIVPAGSDATTVNIYGATTASFTAATGTLLGSVAATPGESQTFTFTADTDEQYFFAVQSVDSASNFSAPVGSDGATVSQSTADAVALGGSVASDGGGEVAGDSTDDASAESGEVAAATDDASSEDGNESSDESSDDSTNVLPFVLIALGLGAGYYAYKQRSEQ